MLAWQGNLDIQFCYDGFAVVTYITDYLSKGDAGITAALRQAITETKGCNDFERLNYMKRVFFTHRQVSVAEAAYRLIPGMNLTSSSVKTTFVSSGYEENRSRMYTKTKHDDDFSLQSDSEYDSEDGSEDDFESYTIEREKFSIPGREGTFEASGTTIHEKYQNRPKIIENVCLAQFATSYEPGKKPKNIVFENGASHLKGQIKQYDNGEAMPKYIILNIGGCMRLRNSPSILRIHSSKKNNAAITP